MTTGTNPKTAGHSKAVVSGSGRGETAPGHYMHCPVVAINAEYRLVFSDGTCLPYQSPPPPPYLLHPHPDPTSPQPGIGGGGMSDRAGRVENYTSEAMLDDTGFPGGGGGEEKSP